mmetsp:Transcript_15101/g.14980  ORF Transcript_15101/g.14980 Transcript_15101/m.14980 type:complete len:80 (+) Transcript_15101:82-321(+)
MCVHQFIHSLFLFVCVHILIPSLLVVSVCVGVFVYYLIPNDHSKELRKKFYSNYIHSVFVVATKNFAICRPFTASAGGM